MQIKGDGRIGTILLIVCRFKRRYSYSYSIKWDGDEFGHNYEFDPNEKIPAKLVGSANRLTLLCRKHMGKFLHWRNLKSGRIDVVQAIDRFYIKLGKWPSYLFSLFKF